MSVRTHRHLPWRVGGLSLMAAGCASAAIGDGASAMWSLAGFVLAIVGLVLVVQGGRVPLALRVERSRHRELPMAIHARRLADRLTRSRG
ncbi:hypothetical protein [Sphingomonas bacterium]|uniref:hypothetical protein n=1 Tax=Sphingomonas bacterium TaxID=1895847 RepID=UPI00157751CF|nr:hypothetical protein [Sphingomonas bacterium]